MILAATACDRSYPTLGSLDALVINGMLVVDAPVQEILVERTRSVSDGYLRGISGVAGATVVVTGPEGEAHAFTAVPDRAGYYRADFRPRVDAVYTLRVESSDGLVATGRTRTPAPPVWVQPSADTTITGAAALPLTWHRARGAGYVVTYSLLTGREPEYLISVLLYEETDVLTDTIGTAIVGSFSQYPAGAAIAVASVDSCYRRFVRPEPGESIPRSSLRSTLIGGLGLFGSVAFSPDRRVAVVQP